MKMERHRNKSNTCWNKEGFPFLQQLHGVATPSDSSSFPTMPAWSEKDVEITDRRMEYAYTRSTEMCRLNAPCLEKQLTDDFVRNTAGEWNTRCPTQGVGEDTQWELKPSAHYASSPYCAKQIMECYLLDRLKGKQSDEGGSMDRCAEFNRSRLSAFMKTGKRLIVFTATQLGHGTKYDLPWQRICLLLHVLANE